MNTPKHPLVEQWDRLWESAPFAWGFHHGEPWRKKDIKIIDGKAYTEQGFLYPFPFYATEADAREANR